MIPCLITRERCAFAVVVPAIEAMRCLAALAHDHLVRNLISANWTFHVVHNGGFTLVQELHAFGVDQHHLIKDFQRQLNKLFQVLAVDEPSRSSKFYQTATDRKTKITLIAQLF